MPYKNNRCTHESGRFEYIESKGARAHDCKRVSKQQNEHAEQWLKPPDQCVAHCCYLSVFYLGHRQSFAQPQVIDSELALGQFGGVQQGRGFQKRQTFYMPYKIDLKDLV